MFVVCRFCSSKTKKLSRHLVHIKVHRNITHLRYCGFNSCKLSFKTDSSLTAHYFRDHAQKGPVQYRSDNTSGAVSSHATFECKVPSCKQVCDQYGQLMKHVKRHISQGTVTPCPFPSCAKSYSKLNSFTGHLSKCHRQENDHSGWIVTEVENSVTQSGDTDEHDPPFDAGLVEGNHQISNGSPEPPLEPTAAEQHLLTLAQFYLKLESDFLLPVSTVQYICTEIENIIRFGHAAEKDMFDEYLSKGEITQSSLTDVLCQIMESNLFFKSNKRLNTAYKRKKFYKSHFSFVEPLILKIPNGPNDADFFHYVPIRDSLRVILENKFLSAEFNANSNYQQNYFKKPELLKDYTDGSVFLRNPFFKENPGAVQLILYQDSFEIVNPIGQARTKHKLLAVYASIGNFPAHIRSDPNNIILIALCKEKQFKEEVVYGKIVDEIKDLEQNGVVANGSVVKASVVCILGDNLGSHVLAGLVANFSTAPYFCRYCLISRNEFYCEDGETTFGEPRTVESYCHALQMINPDQNDVQGVKRDSIFNQLPNFHVCNPGLPPCLAHDAFEGIIGYDLSHYIKRLVKKKWFTFVELNKLIAKSFPYTVADNRDKPSPFTKSCKRIPGSACQVWNFLRLFPLIISHKVKDEKDEIWQAVLCLSEIMEIVCAPEINRSYLPYLETLIQTYLSERRRLLLNIPLRPKHHFLLHYPFLIDAFGPLTKVWTLMFETKHMFFKRVIRNIHNFINVTKTLAEKHELRQSYLRLGSIVRSDLDFPKTKDFFREMYCAGIINSLNRCGLYKELNLQECESFSKMGTVYNRGDIVVIRQDGYHYNTKMGRVCLMLIDKDYCPYFVAQELTSKFVPKLCAYEVAETSEYVCIELANLLSFEPLSIIQSKFEELC